MSLLAMRPLSPVYFFSLIAAIAPIALVGLAPARADEPKTAPASAETAKIEDPAASVTNLRRAAVISALRAGRGNDAEKEIAVLFDQSSGAQERAVEWFNIALFARATGEIDSARQAARKAWQDLDRAELRLSKQPEELAQVQLLRAALTEEFLGTTDQAEQHDREAARLAPTNPQARELSARLALRDATTKEQPASSAVSE